MSWELVKGIEKKPVLNIKRCLRLDGVNDYLSLGNSNFYNIGNSEFTIHFKVFKRYDGPALKSLYRTADEGEGGTGVVSRIVFLIYRDSIQISLASVVSGVEKIDYLRFAYSDSFNQ